MSEQESAANGHDQRHDGSGEPGPARRVRRALLTIVLALAVGILAAGLMVTRAELDDTNDRLDRAADEAEQSDAARVELEDRVSTLEGTVEAVASGGVSGLDARVDELESVVDGYYGFGAVDDAISDVERQVDDLTASVEVAFLDVADLRSCVNSLIRDLQFGESFFLQCY